MLYHVSPKTFYKRILSLSHKKQGGEVILGNTSTQAIRKAQSAFLGAAEAMGLSSEEDVQALVNEARYERER